MFMKPATDPKYPEKVTTGRNCTSIGVSVFIFCDELPPHYSLKIHGT